MSTFGPERISISVGDLARALAFYRDWMGMAQVGDYTLDPHETEALWRLPAGSRARSVLLKNANQSTLVELLDFGHRSRTVIRPNPRSLDLGYWGLSFMVHDIDGLVEDLKQKGFRWTSEAMTYYPAFLKYGVRNVALDGPDHNPIYHYERLTGEPLSGPRYIELNHVAMIVDDVPAYKRFFGDILGLVYRGEFNDNGAMNTLFDMPAEARGKEGFYSPAEGKAATMNYVFIEPGGGRSLAEVSHPPNLGEFQSSFRVDDLAEILARVRQGGFKILSGPLELHGGHLGKRQAATVSGPAGLMVELFQPA
jgi:catechol 2,3-dioxygenase-like lactoylglutathione lyase family enzyme